MTEEAGRDSRHEPLEQSRAFGGVIDILEAIGATYAIWDGLSVVAYGEPRFTMDMDVLLDHRGFPVELFVRRLQESHYHVDRIAVQRAVVEADPGTEVITIIAKPPAPRHWPCWRPRSGSSGNR